MSPKRTVSLLDAPIDEDVPGLPEDDTLREMSCCGCWIRPNIRQRPHYAGEIWKRNFVSTVRPTVHTNPSRKQSFSKTLFKPEEFENAGFTF